MLILSLLKKYDDLILNNASQISSIESSLRTLTYVLPGRFADAEFASEALFAALNLIGLYHDSILARAAENLPPSKKPSPSPHNRYTRYWINSSKTYQRASLALTFLQYTDVLLEMGVQKKWGKEVKWKLISIIELIKREIDPSIFNSEDLNKSNGDAMNHEQRESDTWVGRYTNRVHDSISIVRKGCTQYSQNYDVNEYLMGKVLMVEDVRKPPDLVHKLHSFGKLGELLYILRPLIYVIALQKYGNKSWRPWLLSLFIELSTIILTNYFYKTQIPGGYRWLSTLEKEERKRRIRQFFFYILRGPFYEQFTRPKVTNFCNSVSNKPILALFGGILRDYQPLWENIYFYTASS
ncbi:16488_t:CDS:2 [Cetraspora pellucida]|uniref:16488_t:CDS:1 n=1 Tax=Cetraspora pellucida TaxID=1433469 RepID=A0ACA9K9B2_9GLOM|nr:16488_t:CDS:2 [Cetraspora pellucida]